MDDLDYSKLTLQLRKLNGINDGGYFFILPMDDNGLPVSLSEMTTVRVDAPTSGSTRSSYDFWVPYLHDYVLFGLNDTARNQLAIIQLSHFLSINPNFNLDAALKRSFQDRLVGESLLRQHGAKNKSPVKAHSIKDVKGERLS